MCLGGCSAIRRFARLPSLRDSRASRRPAAWDWHPRLLNAVAPRLSNAVAAADSKTLRARHRDRRHCQAKTPAKKNAESIIVGGSGIDVKERNATLVEIVGLKLSSTNI